LFKRVRKRRTHNQAPKVRAHTAGVRDRLVGEQINEAIEVPLLKLPHVLVRYQNPPSSRLLTELSLLCDIYNWLGSIRAFTFNLT
jgi:hypothetical protein